MTARVFLDWCKPLLPQAAAWLAGFGARGSTCDLAGVVCVVPGRRAGRLLLHELAEACAASGAHLVPPEIVTPGALIDTVLPGARAAATPAERTLAWMEVLRTALPIVVQPLLPARPEPDDVPTWLELAATIGRLHDELAGESISFDDVAERAARMEFFGETDRWIALAHLAREYDRVLADHGLVDPHRRRRDALAAAGPLGARRIVLIGVTDLNAQQRSVVVAAGDGATALVHAPPSGAADFDDVGCVIEERWREAPISVADHQLVVAEGPADQAQAVMDAIDAFGGRYAFDDITIGVGAEDLVEPLIRAAKWAGLAVHSALGVNAAHTPPWRLLHAVADYLEHPRFAELAALARHPDLERSLGRGQAKGAQAPFVPWPSRLDRYYEHSLDERLQIVAGADAEAAEDIQRLVKEINRLVAPVRKPKLPLREWAALVLELLRSMYGALPAVAVQSAGPAERITIAACLSLRDTAAAYATAPAALQPSVNGPTALRLLLAQAARETVAAEIAPGEIELLGWLELLHDPAPALVLCGCNDGRIPEAILGDPFLPDALRHALGLSDNRRRYARDAYRLQAICHSRRDLVIVAGRCDSLGEPLTPSRLLLSCDDETMLARVRRLSRPARRPRHLPRGAPPPGGRSRFKVPPIPPEAPLPKAIAVTEFANYLLCPYRWALKKAMRLKSRRDDAVELDAMSFGTLAHEALRSLDERVPASSDERAIATVLIDALHNEATRLYGARPMPAVLVQVTQLEQRLRALAAVQARLFAEGWLIRHTEIKLPAGTALIMGDDEEPITITGKIDRIDHHPATGRFRIIDYKTGDKQSNPIQLHNGVPRLPHDGAALKWKDLQLPLYHHLAGRLGISGTIELAFVALARDPADVGLVPAAWSREQLEDAIETARGVVRDIRARRFEPNPKYPYQTDEFSRICQTAERFAAAGSEAAPPVAP